MKWTERNAEGGTTIKMTGKVERNGTPGDVQNSSVERKLLLGREAFIMFFFFPEMLSLCLVIIVGVVCPRVNAARA